ncbi:hypothetical protein LQ948_05265 [Jiella sp. MQZ9-1]|uniref:Histidine kinase n=1 Tax=Jiella flava TaxID=2816857 RepID=A0A939FYX2_9HYPH|nr:hypothetical protein [Jiella flava]MBO0662057.1 hypothetical protein [Jiella flava]MCD2470615.1 hypothetical protein [Jiella flava]
MPTLVRLLTILALIAGTIYGIMAALVYFVQPTQTEVRVPIILPEAEPAKAAVSPVAGPQASAATDAAADPAELRR